MDPITVGSVSSLPELTDLVERRWKDQDQILMPSASRLFIKETKANFTGNSENFAEFDTDIGARNKLEFAYAKKLGFGVGYSKVAYLKRIASEREISYELRTQNKIELMGKLVDASIKDCPYRYELDLTHILTFGLDASYTDMDGQYVDLRVGDGQPLFSETHLLKYSSDTYSNILAGGPEFSASEFENILEMNNTEDKNNFGKAITLDYSVVFHARNVGLGNRIREVLDSSSSLTDNKNSGVINPLRNGTAGRQWDVIELTHLATTITGAYDSTKSKWWGIASVGMMGWQAFASVAEANHSKPLEETRNDAIVIGTRMGYLRVAVSGRGIKISPVGYNS